MSHVTSASRGVSVGSVIPKVEAQPAMIGGHWRFPPGAVTSRLKVPGTPAETPLEIGFGDPWIVPVHGTSSAAIEPTTVTAEATPATALVTTSIGILTPPRTIWCAASTSVLA